MQTVKMKTMSFRVSTGQVNFENTSLEFDNVETHFKSLIVGPWEAAQLPECLSSTQEALAWLPSIVDTEPGGVHLQSKGVGMKVER